MTTIVVKIPILLYVDKIIKIALIGATYFITETK